MKSFLQGKKSLEVSALRAPAGSVGSHARLSGVAHSAHSSSHPGAPSPNVEIVKEGGKVVRLVVTCGCGERVEIECLYAAGS